MTDALRLLEHSPIFGSLAPAHREQVAGYLTRHEFVTGAEIVRQGTMSDCLHLIASGSVGVYVRDPVLGVSQITSTMEFPDSIGESALLQSRPLAMSCVAIQPTVTYRLDKDVLEAILQQLPMLATRMAAVFAARLEEQAPDREIPWTSLAARKFDARLWSSFPENLLRSGRVAPLALSGRTLVLGMVDPLDKSSLDAVARAMPGVRCKVYAVSADDWQRFVDAGTGKSSNPQKSPQTITGTKLPVTFVDDDSVPGGRGTATGPVSPAVAFVDDIVSTGLGSGASDIHVEHERRGVGVRFRIDGVLQSRHDIVPMELGKAIVSRIKLLSRLDITDTRKPQEGRMSVRVNNSRIVDLRVSTLPAKFGEKIVMRVLDSEGSITDLKALFMVDKVRQIFAQMIFRPMGLVLVTGPSGSGKTTTMYSALHARRRPELNIVTVEDPIEYHLDGVTQAQVAPELGTTFETVLRALLRQDPDVIMVGELRDLETAKTAVEAANTGHCVISSMHSNGAFEAVDRLLDWGVHKFALGSGLIGVLHQRLVRRVCPGCVETFDYPAPVMDMLHRVGALPPGNEGPLARGRGCARCNNTGLKGRVAIYEILIVNDAVREAISRGVPIAELKSIAMSGAMVELSKYAGVLLTSGITVPSEVLHILQQIES